MELDYGCATVVEGTALAEAFQLRRCDAFPSPTCRGCKSFSSGRAEAALTELIVT